MRAGAWLRAISQTTRVTTTTATFGMSKPGMPTRRNKPLNAAAKKSVPAIIHN
jgi:hypothetical protein